MAILSPKTTRTLLGLLFLLLGACGHLEVDVKDGKSVPQGQVFLEITSFDVRSQSNNNSAVALDLVIVYDKGLIDKFLSMSATEYFKKKRQLTLDYPVQIQVKNWEIAPSQTINPYRVHYAHPVPEAAFIYANYGTPGEHRLRVGDQTGIQLILGKDQMAMRKLTNSEIEALLSQYTVTKSTMPDAKLDNGCCGCQVHNHIHHGGGITSYSTSPHPDSPQSHGQNGGGSVKSNATSGGFGGGFGSNNTSALTKALDRNTAAEQAAHPSAFGSTFGSAAGSGLGHLVTEDAGALSAAGIDRLDPNALQNARRSGLGFGSSSPYGAFGGSGFSAAGSPSTDPVHLAQEVAQLQREVDQLEREERQQGGGFGRESSGQRFGERPTKHHWWQRHKRHDVDQFGQPQPKHHWWQRHKSQGQNPYGPEGYQNNGQNQFNEQERYREEEQQRRYEQERYERERRYEEERRREEEQRRYGYGGERGRFSRY